MIPLSPEILAALALALLIGAAAGAWPARRRLLARTAEAARQAERADQLQERVGQLERDLAGQAGALEDWRTRAQDGRLELARLQAAHQEKLAALADLRQAFEQSRAALKTEFQQLASQVLEEKSRGFSQSSQDTLDGLLRPFREQIDGFQRRVNEIHDASVRGQARLDAEIRRVLDVGLKMSGEAQSLATALKGDKKTTGNWGEVVLERSLQLAGLIAGDHYQAQAPFRDEAGNRRQPDFVVHLPDGKHLIIDSKVSLVDYDRAVAADTPEAREAALAAHARAVRHHIDDLGRKDYSGLIGMKSPGFVLMYMPIEPAYIEAMRHDRELFDYGYRRNVVLVSHTTLMPILRTVATLWMLARGNEQARALSEQAGGLYRQVEVVADRLQKLGHALGAAATHYNSTVTAVTGQRGLYGKVGRFAELSAKAGRSLPPLEPLHADFEVQRLDGVASGPECVPGAGNPSEPLLSPSEPNP
ncbi:DNA recombination protein RmuC [Castellaniella defragrans]|uniref:DNA recombination protein RmuC n=1 Tax=Castellaniella defragrans TaxID=75697 RepID=A0A7W9WM62_CASDE|nr:DNA recombination protein RmuC [Castellaniella defragrans]MBB6082054.1 DNA recombination protein RmuC [Castellaniella defragrans]